MHNVFDNMPSDIYALDADSHKPAAAAPVTLYRETCPKCRGSGRYNAPSSLGTKCFSCEGRGFNEYKHSAEYRKASRDKSAARKVAKAEQAAAAKLVEAGVWLNQHYHVAVWLKDELARGNEFAQSMLEAVKKWGSLTEGQLAAIDKGIARNAERAAATAQIAATAPEVSIARVEAAFAKALSTGLQRPKLHLDAFVFKPAKSTGVNPGAIYVTEEGVYLGKVMGGKFLRVRECTPEQEAAIVAAASNPAEAAVRYGRLTGACSVCSRKLVDPVSVERAIGPICAEKYGF